QTLARGRCLSVRCFTFFKIQLDISSHRKNFDRFSKRGVLQFHQEFDGIARFLTAKTMVKTLRWCYMEGRGAFVMKWTEPFIRTNTSCSQRNMFFNYSFHTGCLKYFIGRLSSNASCHVPESIRHRQLQVGTPSSLWITMTEPACLMVCTAAMAYRPLYAN